MTKDELVTKDLPDVPGVYFFLDTDGGVLYIGKATSLRDRTKSYFANDIIVTRGPRIVDMVTKSVDIDWMATDSVLEALILEANLIKKHKPPYNVVQKDDRSFNYVVITDEEWPRVFTERGRVLKNRDSLSYRPKYIFGPFPNGGALKESLKIIRKIFPFRDKKSYQKSHERFYRQLGLAPGDSTSESLRRYQESVKNIRLLFQGKKKTILRELKKSMDSAAEHLLFEEASRYKKQIDALTHIQDVSLLKRDVLDSDAGMYQPRIEAYDVAHLSGKSMVGVMVVTYGIDPDKSEYRKFTIRGIEKADDTGALEQVLRRRFKHAEWDFPDIVVVDGSIAQYNVATRVLGDLGLSIDIVAVTKDDKHRPKSLHGDATLIKQYKAAFLVANNEAHRFSLSFHKDRRSRSFVGKRRKK